VAGCKIVALFLIRRQKMKWGNWKQFTVMILLAVMLCAAACARKGMEKCKQPYAAQETEEGELERKVTEAEVPAAALTTLKKLARGANITEFAEEIEYGHTFYEGSWKALSGAKMDVLVTPTGDLVEIEEQVGNTQVPVAVMRMARKAAGRDAQLAFEKKTMILYEAKFRKGSSRHELLLSPDGRCVEQEVEKGKRCGDKDKKGLSIDEIPKVVRATILRHARGGEIKEIELEDEGGKIIYEAEVIIGGREVDLKVAPNGRLLSKETDEGDDEGDDDEHDED
jgi:uncharacterized membrane protein YkoI